MGQYSNDAASRRLEETPDPIALDEKARTTIDDPVFEAVLLDEIGDRSILCARLNPQSRDIEFLGFLEDTKCDLVMVKSLLS